MLAQLFLHYVLAAVLGIGVDVGYGTVFGTPNDPHDGGNLACEHRPIPDNEPLCAHRWLPCGTEVVLLNLERDAVTTCRIADRGPFGIDRATGLWRGMIDLTPQVATAIRLDGRDLLRMVYLLPEPGSSLYEQFRFLVPPKKGIREQL